LISLFCPLSLNENKNCVLTSPPSEKLGATPNRQKNNAAILIVFPQILPEFIVWEESYAVSMVNPFTEGLIRQEFSNLYGKL
jgi:hypothetical protein